MREAPKKTQNGIEEERRGKADAESRARDHALEVADVGGGGGESANEGTGRHMDDFRGHDLHTKGTMTTVNARIPWSIHVEPSSESR